MRVTWIASATAVVLWAGDLHRHRAGTGEWMRSRLSRVAEIEKLMARDDMGSNGAKALDAMGTPRAAFSRPTPPAARAPRAELVRIADMYFSGMQLNDGKGKSPSRTTAIGWRTG